MSNHGDIVYKDGAGNTHYSDGSTSYELGGTTFYSDGTTSYESDGKTFYSDGSSSYESNHTVFHSNGSTSQNHISFANDFTDTLMGNNNSAPSYRASSTSTNTGWIRTPSTSHSTVYKSVFDRIVIAVASFFLGCYYAVFISVGIWILSCFTDADLRFLPTYILTAIITGIILVMVNSCFRG